jgi:hypothetical protein
MRLTKLIEGIENRIRFYTFTFYMKKVIVCLVILLSFEVLHAQNCLDPSRIPDPYFQCLDPIYEPVCGCDNITYRNRCAAENWGGLINDGFAIGWTENTVCGNFDFEIVPSMIKNLPVQMNMYSKTSGEATLYVYDRMGKLVATPEYFHVNGGYVFLRQFDFQSLELGIYFAQLVYNGEYQTRKIGKVSEREQ